MSPRGDWRRCNRACQKAAFRGGKKAFSCMYLTGLGPQEKPDTFVLGREKEMIAMPSTNKQKLSTIRSIFCGTFRNNPSLKEFVI